MVRDDAGMALFVNGKRVAVNGRASDMIDGGEALLIGMSSKGFRGIVDQVRISNTVRYTTDFTPEGRFEADQHTQGLYRFDEGEGEKLSDDSGHGRHPV